MTPRLFHRHSSQDDPFSLQERGFKDGNFNGKFRQDWVEATFMPSERSEEVMVNRLNPFFMSGLKVIGGLVAAVLIGRLGWLQVVKGEYYQNIADGNRIRLDRVEASRGTIYDRTGRPLVHNTAHFLLYSIPSDLPKEPSERTVLFERLSSLLGVDIAEAVAEIEALTPDQYEYYQPIFIADNIDYERALTIYLESFSTPGIHVQSKHRREYDLPVLSLSHVLGYTGTISQAELEADRTTYSRIDYTGKSGLEKAWEAELRGVHGSKQIEVDALGKEKHIVSQTPPQAGRNLVLSIDGEAQAVLERLLSEQLSALTLKKAAAIALDPRNGEVIALVSLPAFDNNLFTRGISVAEYTALIESEDKPLFNRAIQGEYAAGSTVKPVVAAAALQEGIITPNTSFLSTGGLRIGQWFFPDWKAGGHGATTVIKAIAESVNTFFYYIGGGYDTFTGLGVDKMVQWYLKFGLGKPLGIDLPGEAIGFVPTKQWKESVKQEPWYIGDTYHISIGQGDLITTPLQIAAWTSYFANGGTIYRPHIVKEITEADGRLSRAIEPVTLVSDIIDSAHIDTVRRGLRQTAVSGSAASLSSLPVEAAGKTGTAQWSSKKPPHAWFTGFAPYDNAEIVITVLIEEGEEGSRAATPVAREFLQWYFTRGEEPADVTEQE